jgi:RNA polymerase sigma-70 factor (ECF subfamily)
MEDLRKTFSQIYDQNIDKIYRFIFFKVNSQEIAQDLCSETFLRTWEKFKQGKENPLAETSSHLAPRPASHGSVIKNPRAFLYQTARNLVIDHYREKGRTQVVSTESTPIVDPREDLEEEAILRSDLRTIKTALTALKEDYQDVIIWHYLNDLPIPDVSELLGRSEETTRVLLHRAIKALKAEVNKQETKES